MFVVQPILPADLLTFHYSTEGNLMRSLQRAFNRAKPYGVSVAIVNGRLVVNLPDPLFGSEHATYEAAMMEAGRVANLHRVKVAVLRRDGEEYTPMMKFAPEPRPAVQGVPTP